MGRSRKHRKRFACGHRGFGQWCHCCESNSARCAGTIALTAVAHGSVYPTPRTRWSPVGRRRSPKQRVQQGETGERQAWKASFAADRIDLRRLPTAIVLKARGLMTALGEGVGYWQLKGKRLRGDRTVVSLPVSYRYRLLCRLEGDRLLPLKVLSHEAYNPLVRRQQRV